MAHLGIDQLKLGDPDSDVEGLFDSPVRKQTERSGPIPPAKDISTSTKEAEKAGATADRAEKVSHEQSLRTELAQLQQMNATLENLNGSLSTARDNLQTMQSNMDTAKTLLKTWSRILSQAEHDQRLILNSRWQGATHDIEELANEDMRREADAQRKEQEDNARRAMAQQRQEEELQRRQAEAQKRTRGVSRTRSVRGTGASALTRGQASVSSTRGRGVPTRGAASGIARGAATVRGRARGT